MSIWSQCRNLDWATETCYLESTDVCEELDIELLLKEVQYRLNTILCLSNQTILRGSITIGDLFSNG